MATKISALTADRDERRGLQREWIERHRKRLGYSLSRIAELAGFSRGTLTNFMKETWPYNLKPDNLAALERLFGEPAPTLSGFNAIANVGEFHESEVFDIGHLTGDTAQAVRLLCGTSNSRLSFVLRSRALEAVGYVPGDVLIVDTSVPPKAGDVVCANVRSKSGGDPEIIFRMFFPLLVPLLITATAERSMLAPLIVDGDKVAVVGVVLHRLGARQIAA